MHLLIDYFFPFFYFILLAFLLQRNKFLLSNGFSPWIIVVFFTAKCLAGILSAYLSLFYSSDLRLNFNDGLELYQTLLHNPSLFINLLREKLAIQDLDLFNSQSGFIHAVFVSFKFIQVIANLLSGGNIYTNTILFNGLATLVFLRFWIFLKNYTSGWATGAWLFLLPSAFFYTSNILKEAIACALIAMLLPMGYKLYKSFRFLSFTVCIILFCLLFFFKFIIAITFAYTVFTWWALSKYPKFKAAILLSVTTGGVAVFFLARNIVPALDFPAYVAQRQQEFLALKANSMMQVQVLQSTFISFLKILPSAIGNVLFKPVPAEGGQLLYLVHAIEIYLFWAFIIYTAYKNKFKLQPGLVKPLFWSMLLFAISNLLIIGYIIPNIGALVRYRSIFLPWIGIFCWHLFNSNNRATYLAGLPRQPESK